VQVLTKPLIMTTWVEQHHFPVLTNFSVSLHASKHKSRLPRVQVINILYRATLHFTEAGWECNLTAELHVSFEHRLSRSRAGGIQITRSI